MNILSCMPPFVTKCMCSTVRFYFSTGLYCTHGYYMCTSHTRYVLRSCSYVSVRLSFIAVCVQYNVLVCEYQCLCSTLFIMLLTHTHTHGHGSQRCIFLLFQNKIMNSAKCLLNDSWTVTESQSTSLLLSNVAISVSFMYNYVTHHKFVSKQANKHCTLLHKTLQVSDITRVAHTSHKAVRSIH